MPPTPIARPLTTECFRLTLAKAWWIEQSLPEGGREVLRDFRISQPARRLDATTSDRAEAMITEAAEAATEPRGLHSSASRLFGSSPQSNRDDTGPNAASLNARAQVFQLALYYAGRDASPDSVKLQRRIDHYVELLDEVIEQAGHPSQLIVDRLGELPRSPRKQRSRWALGALATALSEHSGRLSVIANRRGDPKAAAHHLDSAAERLDRVGVIQLALGIEPGRGFERREDAVMYIDRRGPVINPDARPVMTALVESGSTSPDSAPTMPGNTGLT